MSLPPFSTEDIERWFGTRQVNKAAGYVASVDKLSVQAQRLTAEVKGTASAPYRVTITFYAGRRGPATGVHARCTCPVAWNCKHSAAVLLAALRAKSAPTTVNPAVLAWLEAFQTAERPAPARAKKPPSRTQVLLYLLEPPPFHGASWRVSFLKGYRTREGDISQPLEEWSNVERALLQPPRFVDEDDQAILRMLWLQRDPQHIYSAFPLDGPHGAEILQRMLATGRLMYGDEEQRRLFPLQAGDERIGTVTWRQDALGRLVPDVAVLPPAAAVIPVGGLWYLDPEAHSIGPVHTSVPTEQVARLLTIPPLETPDLPVVAAALADLAPHLPTPAPPTLRVIDRDPVPVLELGSVDVVFVRNYRDYPPHEPTFDYARPAFLYDDLLVPADDPAEFIKGDDGEPVRVLRRPKLEARWLKSLQGHGLSKVPLHALYTHHRPSGLLFGLASPEAWAEFMADHVPRLRSAGWDVRFPHDFRHHFLHVESWDAELSQEDGWFNLDMGIVVEGRRLPLPPLLNDLLRRDPRWLDAATMECFEDEAMVPLVTPEGARVAVPAARLKPLVRTLIDLFDGPVGDTLRLSRLDAPRLAELARMEHWQFKGEGDVQRLTERLQQAGGVQDVPTPAGFTLTLRPYQREGLAWLQFLREQQLAGVLADDMGLGKTAQALAHLLTEKNAGRLDRPALVVLPTSLLFNWRREAERCAPALRVLTLHGPARKENFARIPQHDVVLTTYPLLWRDADQLAAAEYHLLILDEAQTVKNAASKAAQAVRKLRARHRLCITGTPLENHLGELWSQFDFLLPGFLGDSKDFTRRFRTPIEKHGDSLRHDLLARRVKPFLLRRRKEDVATELPPKNIIVRSVELEGAQRDLYETVRSAMDEKVREAVAAHGFARSQIVILDALLKLRQVCCDPRLVNMPAAARVKERAKLDLLMEMVPELVDEGRRILIFSQFTTMLDLIAEALNRAGVPHVTLTGQTRRRDKVIDRFQSGEVPVFLISLKAGGVGLNLTAADTVIHYDPWWNPAVENQATDRAHRIGQTRNVFVYKLVVAGSIEEKILALQEKKADLAAGILSDDAAALSKFSEADIEGLLAPLP
ncbi:MAG: SNF2-related protein [Thiohalomonadaceae bacterium]